MNPTTLQKVLELLGATHYEIDDTWDLKRIGAFWFESESIWSDAAVIAEIEEALREDGNGIEITDFFYQEPHRVRLTINLNVCAGAEMFEGQGSTKLAAWCDLFLKYRGVE